MEVLAGLAADDRVVDARGAVDEVQRRVEALLGEPHLRRVRALVGDPAGVDGGHQDPVGREQLLRAGAGEHVQRGLGHVRVRVARALVAAAELALHRRDVDDVGAARGRRRHRGAQPADQDERRGLVAELDLEQLDRVDLVDDLAPAVVRVQVGDEAAGVDRGAGGDPLGRGRAGRQRQRGQRRAASASSAPSRVDRSAAPFAAEREDLGQRAARQRQPARPRPGARRPRASAAPSARRC